MSSSGSEDFLIFIAFSMLIGWNGLVTEVFSDESFQTKAWEKVTKMTQYPLEV
jgi:hypothetical protein